MPDISNINLDSGQVKALLLGENVAPAIVEETFSTVGHSVTYTNSEEPEEAADPIAVLLERLAYLVEKAESLVSRLDEMTTVGGIGTSQKFNISQDEPFKAPAPPKVMKKLKKLKKYSRRKYV